MRKFLIGLGALALFVCLALADTTTTVTNRGQTIVIKTLGNVATDVKDVEVYQDTSKYATKVGEHGTIVRWYDFATMPNTIGVHHMVPEVPMPDNALITAGFIDTVSAITAGTASTNAITILTQGDLYAAATNGFNATGLDDVIPDEATKSHWIQTTSATNLVSIETIGTVTNSTGKLMLILEYILVP